MHQRMSVIVRTLNTHCVKQIERETERERERERERDIYIYIIRERERAVTVVGRITEWLVSS